MGWIGAILASDPARRALGLMLAALTIALFLLNRPAHWRKCRAVDGTSRNIGEDQ
jgi:hypothetical protein